MSFADRIEKGRFIPELKQGDFSHPSLKTDIEQDATQKQIERTEPKITCPYCKSENVISRGKRKNQKGDLFLIVDGWHNFVP